MKYINLFESSIFKNAPRDPQIGDYVICYDSTNEHVSEFTENHIGKITEIQPDERYPYVIEYEEYIPEMGSHFRTFNKDEILHFSSDINDVEMYLTSKKYNL